jgi:apolipoprotein N-acyltransferase
MVGKFACLIRAQSGYRRVMIAGAAGAISALSQAPVHFFPVLWLTFPILVWLIDGAIDQAARGRLQRLVSTVFIGWWFGFGYFLAGLWWVGFAFTVQSDQLIWLIPFAVTLLPAGMALYWAAAIGLSGLIWGHGWRRVVVLMAALSLAELARGRLLTGFPWIQIGYALASNPVFMQTASLVGVSGLTMLSIFVFAAPAISTPGRPAMGDRVAQVLAAVLFVAVPLFGIARLGALPERLPIYPSVHLRIVQPAIAQNIKWHPDFREINFQSTLDLSRRPSTGRSGITHLIWPESAFPFILTEKPSALAALDELLAPGTTLITGAVRSTKIANGKPHFYNSLYVIDHTSAIVSTYDKVHLVPFGEYLPFQSVFEAVGVRQVARAAGRFSAGPGLRLLGVAGAPDFRPLICYEAIFSHQIVGEKRPGWLLNITNDAWFGQTPGPYQHFHQARLRAVEQGIALVRAANTGISAIIDPYGRIIGKIDLGSAGVLDGSLPLPIDITIYSRFGDYIILLILVISLSAGLLTRNKK